MNIYLQLLLVSVVTIYIVDLSGFTESWRHGLARALHIRSLRALPPFDCSLCMVWWVCLAYAGAVHSFTLPAVAFSAFLSFVSMPIAQAFLLCRELMLKAINKLM